MGNVKVRVEKQAHEVRESEEDKRYAVCQTIANLLYTSDHGLEQLKEICNRVKREMYE